MLAGLNADTCHLFTSHTRWWWTGSGGGAVLLHGASLLTLVVVVVQCTCAGASLLTYGGGGGGGGGTRYTCVGTKTCKGDRPGSYGNWTTDANTLASWGIDFVKMDHCSAPGGIPDIQLCKELTRILLRFCCCCSLALSFLCARIRMIACVVRSSVHAHTHTHTHTHAQHTHTHTHTHTHVTRTAHDRWQHEQGSERDWTSHPVQSV
jgi:hypothetical protein